VEVVASQMVHDNWVVGGNRKTGRLVAFAGLQSGFQQLRVLP
jgi:hypothetical protein